LELARRLELRRRDVEANGPRPALGEPRGEVRGSATELDYVEAPDVAEHADRRLGEVPDAPVDLVLRPCDAGATVCVLGVCLRPGGAVLRRVVRPVHRGTRARSR